MLSKSKLLKTANIYVSEDLSRKTREHRNELFKYMRYVRAEKHLKENILNMFKVKRRAPNRKCVIRYDKLYVDNDCFVYDESEGRVVRYCICIINDSIDMLQTDIFMILNYVLDILPRQLLQTTTDLIQDWEQGLNDKFLKSMLIYIFP